jgi:SAM-dependent methyltransferase
VLEIGAGTGRNLPLYRHATRVVALEPGPGMRARANQAARAAPLPVEVVDGRAEDLPFADASFDTVVASLVLCTVPDPAQALAEARRVLRPGGRLRCYQHVRADDPRLARWQDRLERPWGWLALAATPTATSWPPSPPPGSACWSWTGSTSTACPAGPPPTSSGSRSGRWAGKVGSGAGSCCTRISR